MGRPKPFQGMTDSELSTVHHDAVIDAQHMVAECHRLKKDPMHDPVDLVDAYHDRNAAMDRLAECQNECTRRGLKPAYVWKMGIGPAGMTFNALVPR